MNSIDSVIKGFDSSVSNIMGRVDKNPYVSSALTLFLIVYAAVAAPRLPQSVIRVFDNIFVKLLIFFLIAYYARKNPTVAIVAAIAVMVTLMTVNRVQANNRLAHVMHRKPTVEAMTHYNTEPAGISMEEISTKGVAHIPTDALSELKITAAGEDNSGGQVPAELAPETRGNGSTCGAPLDGSSDMSGCTRVANYRNSFYPQYVNMKPDTYMARYTNTDAGGYDMNSRYAGSDGRGGKSGHRHSDDGDRDW
jgi:hypothetical protein